MANLNPTTVNGFCKISKITRLDGPTVIDVDKLNTDSMTLRQIETHVDTTSYAVSTGWTQTGLFPTMAGCKAGSLIQLTYYFPNRNDSTSWGGMYHEPQYNVGSGWVSLGSSGYDGNVMVLRSQTIASYTNTILIDPNMSSDFSIQFRFYSRSYDGTTDVNSRNNINTISGTAPLMGGVNSDQHYFHIIVEEYGKIT